MSRTADAVLEAEPAWHRLLSVRTERDAAAAGLVHDDGGWRWHEDASQAAHHLAALYTPLCLDGPAAVFGQLGQSLDGCIATRTGDAVYVTGEEDRCHLHRLRALADAVIVGAGTAIADDPRLTVRACAGANPVRVILDRHGRLPDHLQVFTDRAAPTLRVVDRAATHTGGDDVLALPGEQHGFPPHGLLAALAQRGLTRVLVEGGGRTVSRFLHHGRLDRLYLTVAPVLLGDGVPGLRFPGTPRMREALRAPTRRFELGVDTLFELDLRTTSGHHDGEPSAPA